jgi:hypothetical protein
MNQEANNGTTSGNGLQAGKPTTGKRSNRQGRNRPVLATLADGEQAATTPLDAGEEFTTGSDEGGLATATPTEATGAPQKKSRPRFFSTLGKKEETSEALTADPTAARLSRAMRGKAAAPARSGENKQAQEVSKPAAKAVAPAKSVPARAPARPARKGGFKPRHLIGILLYLLVADVVGVGEQSLLVNNHLERLLFTIGPINIYLSTVMFLLTLVALLIILARFDLVPRSLAPGGPSRPTSKGASQAMPNRDDANAQSGMKQGVKGANDDLYQEYRQNQRYWQRRDRKKQS